MDWRQLRVVVGSEMLEFEATACDRQPESRDDARGGTHASPRGKPPLCDWRLCNTDMHHDARHHLLVH